MKTIEHGYVENFIGLVAIAILDLYFVRRVHEVAAKNMEVEILLHSLVRFVGIRRARGIADTNPELRSVDIETSSVHRRILKAIIGMLSSLIGSVTIASKSIGSFPPFVHVGGIPKIGVPPNGVRMIDICSPVTFPRRRDEL